MQAKGLYSELKRTIKIRDLLRGCGVVDISIECGDHDGLYDTSRHPETKKRIEEIKQSCGGMRAYVSKGNFTINAVFPKNKKHLVKFLTDEGYIIKKIGELNG